MKKALFSPTPHPPSPHPFPAIFSSISPSFFSTTLSSLCPSLASYLTFLFFLLFSLFHFFPPPSPFLPPFLPSFHPPFSFSHPLFPLLSLPPPPPPSMLFSASTDKTGAVWDCEVGERIKKLKGHTSFVNTCCPTRRGLQQLATGSDDGTIKVNQ